MKLLPAGWMRVYIKEVVEPFRTLDPRSLPDQQFVYVDISSIDNRLGIIKESKSFLGSDAPSRARRVIKQGDILFSTVRTYLKNIALVPESFNETLTSTGICVLRPNSAINSQYLFRWVRSDEFVNSMSVSMDGTLYPAVRDSDVYQGFIPLPSLAEQERIVAKLDRLFSRSQSAREELARIPKLIDRYRTHLGSLWDELKSKINAVLQ